MSYQLVSILRLPRPLGLRLFGSLGTFLVLSWFFVCGISQAQTGGQGGLQGTVTDPSGAVISDASVTAVNTATGVSTTRTTSGAGLYDMTPLLPGPYRITVRAQGFKTLVQDNLQINAMKVTGFDPKLTLGATDVSVTVNEAPPALETTNATLGGVMENETYANLPIQMSGQQRDATAFATLMPGAQSGARSPIISGTGNYLAELYIDGIPITTANQQGDNRVIFNSVPIEAVDQFQVLTSSIPVEYQGAGLMNFTVKSGGNQYHGSANIYVRNTIFDTWSYTSKAATRTLADGTKAPARKPYENQNEMALTAGGPIPLTKHKGFFSFTYDRYHGRNGVNPGLLSVPTTKMRAGDFSELLSANGGPGYIIYDPTSTGACTAANKGKICRYAYPNNKIPASQLSPIAQYMEKFLPAPTRSTIVNNYLGGVATGYDNWSYVGRADFDLTPSQRISFVTSQGSRLNVPFTVGANPTLPLPYAQASLARIKINIASLEHAWTISPRLVNQFKYGFVQMGGPPVTNPTQVVPDYAATAAGISNLPPGQSSEEFPGANFSGSNAPTKWTAAGASAATFTSVANTYTALDNVIYTAGRHTITAGFQIQWLQSNASTYDGPSGIVPITYSTSSTALPSGSNAYTTGSGYSYASYMLGAVSSSSLTIQSFGVLGGRYRTIAPYVQDDWKVTPKLTLNLGFRWDYLPPYREAHDRWSFLNPNLTNAVTGNQGMVQFAGDHGAGVSCNCRTPVQTYWKNFGPRVGLAYSIDEKTVLHAGFGLFYSHGGGVGGRSGAASGTGQLGYSVSPSFTDSVNGPAFYLNNSAGFQAMGLANTAFGGPGYDLPSPVGPTAQAQLLNTGNYVGSSGFVQASSVGFADPYLSGRAPTFNFWNAGVQRAITNSLTISLNYAGSQSHFLVTGGSNARGYWANQLNPGYLASLGGAYDATGNTPLLSAPATSANIARAQAILPGVGAPYPAFTAAASTSSGAARATIAQMLVAFPQYSSVSDTWGQNVGNNSYHSFQLSLSQRPWKGLSYTVNYTYAKNLADDGTFRSGFDIPASAISGGGMSYKQGSIERSWAATSVPQNLAIFGVYQLPFGKGGIGDGNWLVRAFAGGWQVSGIYRYTSGTPLAVVYSGCNSPGQGQCMPDLNLNSKAYLTGHARVGNWGDGATGANPGGDSSKIDYTAFQAPESLGSAGTCAANLGAYIPGQSPTKNPNYKACVTLLGNAPRTRALDLQNPSYYNVDMSLRRQFPLSRERFKLILQADCLNVTHKHTFGGINVTMPVGSTYAADFGQNRADTVGTSFGRPSSVSGNRDWQLAAHVTF